MRRMPAQLQGRRTESYPKIWRVSEDEADEPADQQMAPSCFETASMMALHDFVKRAGEPAEIFRR